MVAFIVRRLLGAVGLLLIISAVTYAIFFLVPRAAGVTSDDIAGRFAGKQPDAATLAAIKDRFGLDDPIPVQYGKFIKAIVVGDTYDTGTEEIDCPAPCLGYSFRTNQSVTDQIVDRAPVTFMIAIGAAVLWVLAGVSIGVVSALRRGTIFDRAAMGIALAGVSLPIFFTGLLSLAFVVHRWEILPAVNYNDVTDNPFNLLLPWICLAFLYAALYARLTRAGMLETMNEDFIRTARAKGLPEKTVVVKHGLRATLTPIMTVFGLDIGLLLGGAIITEKTFSIPGLGQLALDGVNQSDLPVVLGATLTTALFIVLANLVVDVLYGVVDPRVRHS
ncbi:ABC transporter permease [Actinomadura graeca]|uniref:ABC transporter permease n=1 Tax=Actinomadura graeca TaxID=2750812 RepID=A0ABX8QSW9_9ACTN|nr:ABC transporter permease [Actinomadura graeca]QXJ19898.1 ABC transporter permease [Actinomadura graeca]